MGTTINDHSDVLYGVIVLVLICCLYIDGVAILIMLVVMRSDFLYCCLLINSGIPIMIGAVFFIYYLATVVNIAFLVDR